MSSLTAERLGTQTPQIEYLPADVHSLDAAQEAVELAENYALELDDSQRYTIEAAMGLREDDTWAAAEVADFEPRQNGKNDTIQAREMWGLFVGGEMLQIHTAHEFATAKESFLRMVASLEAFDDLRKKVAHIRYANGEQGVEFISGARLMYRARTGGASRGFAEADLVVYDESQHAHSEHIAASAPATLVNRNSQLWFAGSGGLSTSEIAWKLRIRAVTAGHAIAAAIKAKDKAALAAARAAAGRLAYIEHTAEQLTLTSDGRVVSERPDNLLDPVMWAIANAAYGTRITAEGLLSMYGVLGAELFARECLCIWDPLPGGGSVGPISLDRWAELVDENSVIVGPAFRAIDVSPDFKWATVAAAGRRSDGHLHVEVGRRNLGTEWVVPFAKQQGNVSFRIATGSPAAFLIPLLKEANVTVVEVSPQEVTQACSRLISAVTEGTVHSLGGNDLPAAIANATISQRGDAQSWSRVKSAGDISALCAATIAAGGVVDESKRIFAY